MKMLGEEKGQKIVNIKKKFVKNNFRKIGKKKDNDVDADMVQLERNNNKCYTSAFRYIQISPYKLV